MTDLRASGAVTGTGDRSQPRAALPALCATQITSWGIVYYAFPVLNPQITASTGWSTTATTAAFSGALLVSAATGIPVGRILDRRGPRAVMTTGSVLGVTAVLAVAHAPNLITFSAAWLLAGVAMAATFYQPAFAALTRWWGGGPRPRAHQRHARRRPGLHRLRPTDRRARRARELAHHVRHPRGASGSRDHPRPRPRTTRTLATRPITTVSTGHKQRLGGPQPPFLMLAAALTLNSFAMYAVVIALVPLLLARGTSPTAAAWALGLGGAGQTLGRTLYGTLASRTGVTTRTVILITLGGATTAAFAVVSGPFPLLVGIAIMAGMVRGNLTLLQATAVTDRWGAAHYGRLSGLLAAPATIASSLAPFAGAALARPLGGYPGLFTLLALVSTLGAFAAFASMSRHKLQLVAGH
ncbi:MFS transporter [Streptomyces chartreusis]|uniref:MFS transporter n=1 Tax=Streptomyces chartreusis TaxID=1969 RepID=UPI0036C40FF4